MERTIINLRMPKELKEQAQKNEEILKLVEICFPRKRRDRVKDRVELWKIQGLLLRMGL